MSMMSHINEVSLIYNGHQGEHELMLIIMLLDLSLDVLVALDLYGLA